MSAAVRDGRTPLDDLRAALASGQLDANAQISGERLLERINAPVRVAVLGLPDSGKSTILNLLAGQEVLPDGLRIPTIQLVYGAEPRTTATLPDASLRVIDGVSLERAVKMQSAFIQVELPIPQLKKISLMEVVAGAASDEQRRALRWVSKRADIALWCTQNFDAEEQALWDGTPEVLQDHSFLVLTKADLLASSGKLAGNIDRLTSDISGRFHSLVPVASKQALASMKATDEQSGEIFASSGGKALVSAILRQVRDGRRADMDSVEVFLHRYADVISGESTAPDVEGVAPQAVPQPEETTKAAPKAETKPTTKDKAQSEPLIQQKAKVVRLEPKPQSIVDEGPAPASEFAAALSRVTRSIEAQPDRFDAFEPQPETTALPDLTPVAEQSTKEIQETVPEPVVVAFSETEDACTNTLRHLNGSATAIKSLVKDAEGDPTDAVIEHCLRAADHLGDILLNSKSDDDQLDGYSGRCQEASETLMLMQLEDGDRRATDAVAILLQLKREFEEKLSS